MPDLIYSNGKDTYEFKFPRFITNDENEGHWIKFMKLLVNKYIGNKDNRINEEAGWFYETIIVEARDIKEIGPGLMGHMPYKNVIWCIKHRRERDGVIFVEYCKKKTGVGPDCRNDEKKESYISASGKVYFGIPWVDYKNKKVRRSRRRSRSPTRDRSRSPVRDRSRAMKDQTEYPVYQGGYTQVMNTGYGVPTASFNVGYGAYPQVFQTGYYPSQATQREQELQAELQLLKAQLSAGYGPPPAPLNSHPDYIHVPALSADVQYPGTGRFFEDKKGTRL